MSTSYRVHPHSDCLYFITITVFDWIPLFLSAGYCDIIIDSLAYCQKFKGLRIHAYVIMPNHLHLIVSTDNAHSLPDVIRDFKRFTSRRITRTLVREGALKRRRLLGYAATFGKGNTCYKVWQDGYHPIAIYSMEVFRQKLRYIHDNPVRKGLVRNAEHWRYSSAGDYLGEERGELEIDVIELV